MRNWVEKLSDSPSEIEVMVRAQMVLMHCENKRAALNSNIQSVIQANRVDTQVLLTVGTQRIEYINLLQTCSSNLVDILGIASTMACTSILHTIWESNEFGCHQVADYLCSRLLDSEPLTSKNFYAKIKTIDARQFMMKDHGELDEMESFLLLWLDRFLSCSTDLREFWDFENDPILDMYEFIINFHRLFRPDEVKRKEFVGRCTNYVKKSYNRLYYWLCMGCGIGVFGMSFARIRFKTDAPDNKDEYSPDQFDEYVARLQREHLTPVLEAESELRTRADERDYCYKRLHDYLAKFDINTGTPSVAILNDRKSWRGDWRSGKGRIFTNWLGPYLEGEEEHQTDNTSDTDQGKGKEKESDDTSGARPQARVKGWIKRLMVLGNKKS